MFVYISWMWTFLRVWCVVETNLISALAQALVDNESGMSLTCIVLVNNHTLVLSSLEKKLILFDTEWLSSMEDQAQ